MCLSHPIVGVYKCSFVWQKIGLYFKLIYCSALLLQRTLGILVLNDVIKIILYYSDLRLSVKYVVF